MTSDAEIAKILDTESDEYRKLAVEHKSLHEKLSAFDVKVYLSPEEELERNTLKKLKLQKKDRMTRIIQEHGIGERAG